MAKRARRPKIIDIGHGQTAGVRRQIARETALAVPVPAPVVLKAPTEALEQVRPDSRREILAVMAQAAHDAKRRAPRNPIRRVELAVAQTVTDIAQLMLDRLAARWL